MLFDVVIVHVYCFTLCKQFSHFLSLPIPTIHIQSSGLTNSSLAWAYHSDTEDQLLTCLPSNQFGDGTELTWAEFKRYGCGWWIRSDALLRRCAEKVTLTMSIPVNFLFYFGVENTGRLLNLHTHLLFNVMRVDVIVRFNLLLPLVEVSAPSFWIL